MTQTGIARGLALSLAIAVSATALSNSGALTAPVGARPGALVSVETLATGLEVPWAIAFATDGRAFVTERPGRIRIVVNGQLEPEPWAVPDVAKTNEGGVLGLALDPDFDSNQRVYVALSVRSADGAHANRLVRMRDQDGTGAIEAVLLDGVRGAAQHDGGRVRIGPDGKIYWTTGDSGSPELSQDQRSLNGKILRINLDGSIPSDNPIPGSPVYSYGHRNPQGLAWQPGTEQLFATEHGPSGHPSCCQDEINAIQPGANFGWPEIVGAERREGMITPFWESGLGETWAPSGADFVASGPWSGSLLFTGLRGEALYRMVFDPNDPSRAVSLERYLHEEFGRLRDVVQGPDGAFYVLTNNRDAFGTPTSEDDRLLRVTLR
jgi:glucose/arabinose dehydrogenase